MARLEDRTLLSGPWGDVLAAVAVPIALGTPKTGTLSANEVVFYQINPSIEGLLVAQVDAQGGTTRLTLMDAQGTTLLTSDGQSPGNPDGQIDLHVSAGTDYLEVENLGGAGAYTLTTTLTPATTPFEPIPVGSSTIPTTLVTGDFTGDGRTDLAVVNSNYGGPGTVSVLLGNGDGTFQNQVTYAVGSSPFALVAGDFTGDGRTDLAVVNSNYGGPGTVSVLLGNGDGTFQDQKTYLVGNAPDAIVTGDFTGDGRTDLAVANSGSNDVSILLGNGDGTFQDQKTYLVGNAPDAIVTGDFTGDGRTDLAVANNGSDDVSVLLNKGDGTFQNQVTYKVGTFPEAIVAGDFTGDGRTDLAVANSGSNDVSVLLGNGDGTFQNQVTYAVGPAPPALVTGDFTGDGHTDLAVANSGSNDVSILLGNGDGTFQAQKTYAVGSGPDAIVAGDFTGDGRTDLAVANLNSNDLSILVGNGDGSFQNQVTYAVGSSPTALVTGDFNGDGRTDLAVANYNSNTVSILLGNGDGTFQNQVTYAVGSVPDAIVAGDFNGDGRLDLAVANGGSNTVSNLLGNGDGTFQNQVTYAVGSYPDAIVAGDFTGDGHTDLAVANSEDNDVSILLGNGNGTFQAQKTYAVGSGPDAIVAGDFTGDGRTDLAVANYGAFKNYEGTVSILLGNGDGTFQNQVTYAVGSSPFALVAGDFTGDGRTDLAVVNSNYGGPGTVSVLLGNGDGTFQDQKTYLVGNAPDAIVTGDFTGDGRTDLAVVNLNFNDVSILVGNGDGTFQDQNQKTYPVGDNPIGLATGDFTGDGRTDLAVVNRDDNDVSVLLGLNGTFAAPGPFAINPHATPLVADVNGDRTNDVLVVDGAGYILYRQGIPGQPDSSNSRPLECDSLWFAHFDSEIMIRHLPRAEMMAKSGLPEPERAPIRQSGTGLGS